MRVLAVIDVLPTDATPVVKAATPIRALPPSATRKPFPAPLMDTSPVTVATPPYDAAPVTIAVLFTVNAAAYVAAPVAIRVLSDAVPDAIQFAAVT